MIMTSEAIWTNDRMRLFRLWKQHPKWPKRKFAEVLNYSIGWVKKWLGRFREQKFYDVEDFKSRSRAPKNPFRKVTDAVRNAILRLRMELHEKYGRVVGPSAILYELHKLAEFAGHPLPTSTATIWRVLKESQAEVKKEKCPVVLPDPMDEWEFDFGEVNLAKDVFYEFAPLIDRGTSILIDIPIRDSKYQADTALAMLIDIFRTYGFPNRFRTDNDPRLVGPSTADGYPMAFVKFVAAIGMELILCDPGRPMDKPFVERVIRTIKHEKLYNELPATVEDAIICLSDLFEFYNDERPHQGRSNRNQPPKLAHPDLPPLNQLPKRVNPDAWIEVYHGELYTRQVDAYGRIRVDHERIQVGREYAGLKATLNLDASNRILHIVIAGTKVKEVEIPGLIGHTMDFDEYAELMIKEARALSRRLDDEKRAKSLKRRVS